MTPEKPPAAEHLAALDEDEPEEVPEPRNDVPEEAYIEADPITRFAPTFPDEDAVDEDEEGS
jgi:hypothetical protein